MLGRFGLCPQQSRTAPPVFGFRLAREMPRYFFNFENDCSAAADLVGRDLSDDDAAKKEAAKLAADAGFTEAVEGQLPTFKWVEVLDESQRPVARLPVADSIREPNRRI
jgi:hypothetical protein